MKNNILYNSHEEEISNVVQSGKCGENVEFSLNKDGTLYIFGSGNMFNYNVWDSISPFTINKNEIKQVVIEDGVKSIGVWAFALCSEMTSITIPECLEDIRGRAFDDCDKLSVIKGFKDSYAEKFAEIMGLKFEVISKTDIPAELKKTKIIYKGECGESITYSLDEDGTLNLCGSGETFNYEYSEKGRSPFKGLDKIKQVVIEDGITYIGKLLFNTCTELKSVSIPESVLVIGEGAFSNCTKLTDIKLPDSLTGINGFAFFYCTGLKSITLPNSLTSIHRGVFFNCTNLKDIKIPDSVKVIKSKAFSGCWELKSITIPKSVTKIESEAFEGCDSLSAINGYKGSYAEEYAEKNKIKFIAIDEKSE